VRNRAPERVIQYSRDVSDIRISRGVLDAPLEPVIGLAEGETRWRGMTNSQFCNRTPSIITVDTVLLPGKFESSQSRRSVPLSQTLRFIL
jgi:hypothetical protein